MVNNNRILPWEIHGMALFPIYAIPKFWKLQVFPFNGLIDFLGLPLNIFLKLLIELFWVINRQEDGESCSFTRATCDVYFSFMCLNNTKTYRQPQSNPFYRSFGRKERLKDSIHIFRCNTHSRIFDWHGDCIALPPCADRNDFVLTGAGITCIG